MTISHSYWTSTAQLDDYIVSAYRCRYDIYLKYYKGYANLVAFKHIKRK